MSERSQRRLAPERLASSWAKLDRAKLHVDEFRTAVFDASEGGPARVLGFSRKFDDKNKRILFIAERLPEIDPVWSLHLGDAIHNLRCALDHLWWQLAIDHLGRVPKDDSEAPTVQFPILTRIEGDAFLRHKYLKNVSTGAGQKAESLLRINATRSLLGMLANVSNHDKHRELRTTFLLPSAIDLGAIPAAACIDCRVPTPIKTRIGLRTPSIGQPVLAIYIEPLGPNPDLKIEPHLSLDIGFGDRPYNLTGVDELGRCVWSILNHFAPLLRRPD